LSEWIWTFGEENSHVHVPKKIRRFLFLSLSKLSVGGLVGMDMDVLEKRKIKSIYVKKYDALLLLSLSKLPSSIYSGYE
jgi:hypothetical protein